jgi:hypothetical protein
MAMDKTLHTEREVEIYLKLPVLASLPILKVSTGRTGSVGSLKRSVVARN